MCVYRKIRVGEFRNLYYSLILFHRRWFCKIATKGNSKMVIFSTMNQCLHVTSLFVIILTVFLLSFRLSSLAESHMMAMAMWPLINITKSCRWLWIHFVFSSNIDFYQWFRSWPIIYFRTVMYHSSVILAKVHLVIIWNQLFTIVHFTFHSISTINNHFMFYR